MKDAINRHNQMKEGVMNGERDSLTEIENKFSEIIAPILQMLIGRNGVFANITGSIIPISTKNSSLMRWRDV